MTTIQEKKRRRPRKKYNSMTYTTGDINYNISRFNKAMGSFQWGDNGFSDAVEHSCSSDCADCGGGLGEGLLTETKRYVRRYYIRPQNIFCSNKAEIVKALIDLDDANCSVYTLNNLGDEKDVSKLMNSDIIYYYDDGILYDKNKVKVMDYDLSIKKEENRKHFANVDNTSEKEFRAEYEDRMTDVTELEEDIKNTDYIIYNGNHCILDTNIFTPELIYNIYSDGAIRMPITLGTCVMNTDFMSFGDGGVYSDSSFDIDGSLGNYELTEWLHSDDGDLIEGDTEYFDSAEDLSERIVSLGKLEVYDKEILHAIEKHINSKNEVNSEDAFNLDFDDVNAYGEKLTEAKQLYCCICGEPIEGYGNNPEPFMSSDEGRCCDGCNLKFVIPMRIDLMRNGE